MSEFPPMGRSELCAWLRANSSGIYRPAAEAAEEIEMLAAAKDQHFAQAMANGAEANRLRAENARLLAVAQAVDAHYSGSLDFQPVYVTLARAAMEDQP